MSTPDPANNLATVHALCMALASGDMQHARPYLADGHIVRWCDYWDLATFKPMLDAIATD